jgi:hypothetical protein
MQKAIFGYAKFYSRSHNAVIRAYDEAGNVIETHEHKGDFKEPWSFLFALPSQRFVRAGRRFRCVGIPMISTVPMHIKLAVATGG